METLSTTKDGYDRVREHASSHLNERVDRLTYANLKRSAHEPDFANRHAGELEREWDLDRAILIPFAAMGGAALLLGLRRNWRWRIPLTAQIGFLLAHALVGWCPPAALLRRLGFRTRQEINAERRELDALRGAR